MLLSRCTKLKNELHIAHSEVRCCALQQLNPEQLKQIEEMIQRNLPAPDTENGD
jgi:hypothetical protein